MNPPELRVRVGGDRDPPIGLPKILQGIAREHMGQPVDLYLRSLWAKSARNPNPGADG